MFGYLHLLTCHMVEAVVVGLSDEVRPILEYNIAWIEAQPEALFCEFPGANKDHWLSRWREVLGLFKWLARGDPAKREFSQALHSRWMDQARVKSDRLSYQDRMEREEYLIKRVALALTADKPLLGLQFLEATEAEWSDVELEFGRWACRHLVDGGSRDATFVARGEEMLAASLVESYRWNGELVEPALWLKVIYFERPEQAITKAYDSMSWLQKPIFVPGGINE